MLTVGGLFSGIGGWELGLERAGMRVLWHCEADPYARAVLERHWPGVPCYPDVRDLRADDVEPVDVLCGGFPCQDISPAGKRVGIDGARSSLWSEMFRLVCELRPRYVFVENSSDLAARGLGRVLGDLAALGFDAEWQVLSACAFGAPHTRERMFVVAYADCAERRRERRGQPCASLGAGEWNVRPWPNEPAAPRVADGVPASLDRNRALGNALVPAIAEWIGGRVTAFEEEQFASPSAFAPQEPSA